MKAYLRAGGVEHALAAPLCSTLISIGEHLTGTTRATLDRLAKLDRERTPGEHAFDRLELLELVISAHELLRDPPLPIRRLRRVVAGPLPAAERIGEVREWLAARGEAVVFYDLWRSIVDHSSTSS